jgi:hypothetical protein
VPGSILTIFSFGSRIEPCSSVGELSLKDHGSLLKACHLPKAFRQTAKSP